MSDPCLPDDGRRPTRDATGHPDRVAGDAPATPAPEDRPGGRGRARDPGARRPTGWLGLLQRPRRPGTGVSRTRLQPPRRRALASGRVVSGTWGRADITPLTRYSERFGFDRDPSRVGDIFSPDQQRSHAGTIPNFERVGGRGGGFLLRAA